MQASTPTTRTELKCEKCGHDKFTAVVKRGGLLPSVIVLVCESCHHYDAATLAD